MAKNEWSLAQLTAKAEAYCAAAEHCISEVNNKLLQWEATSEQAEHIIAHLIKGKYIDEERYCQAFTHDKVLYQGWGRIKIRAALYAKHLSSIHITQALDSLNEDEYIDTLKRVIATKKRAIKSNDPMAREKLIRYCLQRGFTYEEISEHL